ncbi:helix-turn-helix domain-containing protein [Niallia circulans]
MNLLLYLLAIAPGKTSIQKISEKYIVSQSSILNDFKHIEKELRAYHLRLLRTKEGTFIKGDKLSIYRLMAVIIENYLIQMGDPFSQYDIPDSIKK